MKLNKNIFLFLTILFFLCGIFLGGLLIYKQSAWSFCSDVLSYSQEEEYGHILALFSESLLERNKHLTYEEIIYRIKQEFPSNFKSYRIKKIDKSNYFYTAILELDGDIFFTLSFKKTKGRYIITYFEYGNLLE